MNSGREKIQFLLSLLGDKSNAILSELSEEDASTCREIIKAPTNYSSSKAQALIQDFYVKMEQTKTNALSSNKDFPNNKKNPAGSKSGFLDNWDLGENITMTDSAQEESSHASSSTSLRSPKEIADLLSKEKIQLLAFFIKHLDPTLQKEVYENLSPELQEQVDRSPMNSMPISEKIFQKMYDKICLNPAR